MNMCSGDTYFQEVLAELICLMEAKTALMKSLMKIADLGEISLFTQVT